VKDYKSMLKEYNLKATPQRMYMISEIEKSGHIDIDNLYESLQTFFPYISLATVYKNINSMVDNGFLTEVKVPHKKSRYEITKESHAHLFCKECGKLEDIFINTEALYNEAMQNSNYQITDILVTFEGICKECQKLKSEG